MEFDLQGFIVQQLKLVDHIFKTTQSWQQRHGQPMLSEACPVRATSYEWFPETCQYRFEWAEDTYLNLLLRFLDFLSVELLTLLLLGSSRARDSFTTENSGSRNWRPPNLKNSQPTKCHTTPHATQSDEGWWSCNLRRKLPSQAGHVFSTHFRLGLFPFHCGARDESHIRATSSSLGLESRLE